MKILMDISGCIKQMERISKIIIFTGYIVSLLIFASAFSLYIYYGTYKNDYSTGYIWFKELILLCIHMFGAATIPVFIFELFLTASGGKNQKTE